MLSNNTSSNNSPKTPRAGSRSSTSSPKDSKDGGNGCRPEIVKSKSGKSLQGSMKNLRNLVGSFVANTTDHSRSGHRTTRQQFDHVELISDTEEDDSNKSPIISKRNNAEPSHRKSSSSPRGLNTMENSPTSVHKEPSNHNSRRNRRSSTETEHSTPDGRGNDRSLRRSHSGKGLTMTGGHSPVPSSVEQKSRRSKRTSHTVAGAHSPRRDDRSIRKSSSVRGGIRMMVESSDPGPTGNSTRRSRRTSDATDSLCSDNTKVNASMRKSKSHQGLGMAALPDVSAVSIKNSHWSSRHNRRSSDNTKGSTSSMRKSKSSGGLDVAAPPDDTSVNSKNSNWSFRNNRRSSDNTSATPLDPRKQRRRRSNSASRRITRTQDYSQNSLSMSNHSKKSLGMKDESTMINSSEASIRKQRRRRSNSSSRRITRTQEEPPENSLHMSTHTTKAPSIDGSKMSTSDSVSIRKQWRRRSNSASRRLTRCKDEDEKNNLSMSSHSKMSLMKDGSAMNCPDPRKQRRRRSKSASKCLSQSIRDEGSTASDEKSSLTMSIPSQMNSPDPRNQRRSRSNSASRRLSQGLGEVSIASSDKSMRHGNISQLGMSEYSRRASDNSRSNHASRHQKVIDDNNSRRRRGKSGTRLSDNGNASTRRRSQSGLTPKDNDGNRSTTSHSKSGGRLSGDDSRGRQKESRGSKHPRSRSKVTLVGLPKEPASDMSLDLHTTGSVSSLSAGTARPRAKKKYASSGESKERSKRSRSATRILEEPAAIADATLPRKSSAESCLNVKVEQDKSNSKDGACETHNTYGYSEPMQMEKESEKQRSSKSGKKKPNPARRPQIPRQGRKQSIDNSISSLTICSRFHSDDLSLASSQRSQLRRAFSSPKLYFDGSYGSFRSYREEDDDDESFACEKAAESAPQNSRWESRALARSEAAPTIPEHELSGAGSYLGHPIFNHHPSGEGRWSNSTTFNGAPRSSDPDSSSGPGRATPIRHYHDMPPVSAHSRSITSSYGYGPYTPSQSMQSVQTGMVSELTPGTFGGSHAGYSRVSDDGEFGSWMSSMHSLVLHDERGYPEYHEFHEYEPLTTHQKCDTLPRMIRRHSFDSVNILCDNSVGNDSQQNVRSVKSGFTTLMKYDGENDSRPQKPNRRESTGVALY